MKIAIVYQDRKRWAKFAWVHAAAVRSGHDVIRCTLRDEVKAADQSCDLLLFEQRDAGLNEYDLLKIKKSGNAVWAQWWFDLLQRDPAAMFCDQHLAKVFRPIMGAMDVLFTCEKPKFLSSTIYLDQGCTSDMQAVEHIENPEFDAIFIGQVTKHYPDRVEAIRVLCDVGFNVAVFGEDIRLCDKRAHRFGWIDPSGFPEQLARGAVTVHVDIRDDVPGYRSDGFWLKAGAGACVVTKKQKSKEAINADPYFSYSEPQGLVNAVSQLSQDFDRRKRAGEESRRWVMENHTYEHRLKELVGHVEKITNSNARTSSAVPAV